MPPSELPESVQAALRAATEEQARRNHEEEMARSQIKLDVYVFGPDGKDTYATISVRRAGQPAEPHMPQTSNLAPAREVLAKALELHGLAARVALDDCQLRKYSCHQAMPLEAVSTEPGVTLKAAGIVSYYDDVCAPAIDRRPTAAVADRLPTKRRHVPRLPAAHHICPRHSRGPRRLRLTHVCARASVVLGSRDLAGCWPSRTRRPSRSSRCGVRS